MRDTERERLSVCVCEEGRGVEETLEHQEKTWYPEETLAACLGGSVSRDAVRGLL
jgi:hypothetical protein